MTFGGPAEVLSSGMPGKVRLLNVDVDDVTMDDLAGSDFDRSMARPPAKLDR